MGDVVRENCVDENCNKAYVESEPLTLSAARLNLDFALTGGSLIDLVETVAVGLATSLYFVAQLRHGDLLMLDVPSA